MNARAKLQNEAAGRVVYERVVIVTRRTELEELKARFNSVPQARFYLEHAGQDFSRIEQAHENYHSVVAAARSLVPRVVKSQMIEREFLPQYMFEADDLVIAIGPDGLVVNVAKYLDGQPILAVNPDVSQIDGVLLPFTMQNLVTGLEQGLQARLPVREVTMAEARLNDGQTLLAFNDLFIGARSHVSARYDISQRDRSEYQSSSGIIVSTGAGSTGWMRSVLAGAAGVMQQLGGKVHLGAGARMPWDTDRLLFSVREPFPSKATSTGLVFGEIEAEAPLVVTSHMADNGVIFSDGIEADHIGFNSGSTATIGLSDRRARILVSDNWQH